MFVRVEFLVLCACLLYGVSVIVAAEEEPEIETLSLRYLAERWSHHKERASRVAQGVNAEDMQFPFVVLVVPRVTNLLFTGVLISPGFILSVAHVTVNNAAPEQMYIFAGLSKPLTTYPEEKAPGYQVRKGVDKIIKHPGYQEGETADDIVLLSIKTQPFNVTAYVAPIAMAKGPFPNRGEVCRAIGWGKLSSSDKTVMRWTFLWVLMTNSDCSYPGDDYEGLLCGKGEPLMDLRSGDHGGALVCQGVFTGLIRGPADTPESNTTLGGSIHIHVAMYLDWIKIYVSDILPLVELNAASRNQDWSWRLLVEGLAIGLCMSW